ncbi:hybrid sensor histidine kinase/response regulator transcription factor [Desertivirga brevis]|uniref:hybrid sensor histidine kinase/response regulator transcription factor n=1 Tax=Desertivirga brevis TaxID=2810310 RepID=UPI001A95FC9D|nr:hybrid sensor histidine kinase/response regulator transcription factor [Pedobacter sp. SYSU D00873]
MSVKGFLFIFLYVAVLTFKEAGAQEEKAIISPGVRFDHYFSNEGLPDNRVRNLFQDSRGYLWVGTMNGLCRFDGYSFRKFYKNKAPKAITTSWAYSITEDDNSDLYIGSRYGLSKFVRNTEQFFEINVPGSSTDVVSALLFHDRKLWIGTSKGLSLYDPNTRKTKTLSSFPFKNGVKKIIQSWGDCLWLACDQGVVRFNTKTLAFQLFDIDIKPNPYGDRIWSLYEDQRSLYIGTGGDGIIKLEFDAEQNKYTDFNRFEQLLTNGSELRNLQVFDIVKWRNGELWLATEDGLARIRSLNKKTSLEFFRNNPLDKNSISNNIIYRLLIDRTGVLWCGTELGLNKSDLNLLAFQYYAFKGIGIADQVRAIASEDGINIYLGTASSGLYKYNTSSGQTSLLKLGDEHLSYNAYRSLNFNNGNLWAGTLGGTMKITAINTTSSIKNLNAQASFATLTDSRGNLWIGTNKGLLKYDAQGNKVELKGRHNIPTLIKNGFVRQIYEDKKGNLWLGFENGGLIVLDPQSGSYFHFNARTPEHELLGSNVLAIAEAPANVFWVGTESGLNRITLKSNRISDYTVKRYTDAEGLPDKSIIGILNSGDGLLWISTIKGLSRFDILKETFQTYLSNVNFSIGSCYKVSPDKLLFGTSNGFISFNPSLIPKAQNPPTVALSELKLFNQPVEIGQEFNKDIILKQSISSTQEIKLNYHNNVFTIGFTALHFSNPDKNKYSYKMEGFDKNWIEADAASRNATYTNLDAGTYYFKVRASNYMNNWSRSAAVLKVTVLPPPWKTWWAIVLYITLFNILLYILIKYVLIQSRQRQEIEYQKIEKEQLKRLNEMKVNFFTNISHEFRTPLTLISAPVEELMGNASLGKEEKQKVSFIYRNCKKLLLLLDELMTFQKAEQGMLKLKAVPMDITGFLHAIFVNFQPLAERNKINLKLENVVGKKIMAFDPGKLEMVLNNLISNAFKFTPEGGEISIIVALDQDELTEVPQLSITVEDNGKGIPGSDLPYIFERFYSEHNKQGTGVGLALTRNLVELHNGTIKVDSIPGKGTSFKIVLPCKNDNQQSSCPGSILQEFAPMTIDSKEVMFIAKSENQKKTKLLIVEDNKEILDYLEMLFESQYSVARAMNGLEALEIIKENEPELIISDMMMPLMDGKELCKQIKSDLNTSHIPFILLTAKTTDDDKLQGLQTGADDYIAKPFHPEILKVKAENLIESKRRLIEKYRGDGVIIPKDIAKNPLDEQFLQKVLDTINANLANDEFSVEDLGAAVFMSRSHLFRKLKAITGQTPIELIYQVRIKHSMDLLLQRKLSISEIAYEVGFKNPSSFTSSFKKQYGKSPKEYLGDVIKEQQAE